MWVYPPGKGQDNPQEYPGTWLQELIGTERGSWDRVGEELGHRKKNAVWEHKPGCKKKKKILRDSMFERLAAKPRAGSRPDAKLPCLVNSVQNQLGPILTWPKTNSAQLNNQLGPRYVPTRPKHDSCLFLCSVHTVYEVGPQIAPIIIHNLFC